MLMGNGVGYERQDRSRKCCIGKNTIPAWVATREAEQKFGPVVIGRLGRRRNKGRSGKRPRRGVRVNRLVQTNVQMVEEKWVTGSRVDVWLVNGDTLGLQVAWDGKPGTHGEAEVPRPAMQWYDGAGIGWGCGTRACCEDAA